MRKEIRKNKMICYKCNKKKETWSVSGKEICQACLSKLYDDFVKKFPVQDRP